ncbi:MAG: DUF2470 domain-containing protein [Alphaproteobacteria bacterium]|nr:DUF2470 domain-containing protein [Alphaproteobacteria bacterium]
MGENGDDPGKLARRLVRSATTAALTTVLRQDGWPYGSLVLTACDHDAAPILLLSRLAEHSRNLAADARLSLLFDGSANFEPRLGGPRVTLMGRARESHEPRHRARFLARHAEAERYAGLGDFSFYRVEVERAHLVAGFGRVERLDGARILLDVSGARALGEAEGEMIAHMNRDHAEALTLYANALLGQDGAGWTMTGCDPEGCDLRRGGRAARLAFEAPVRDPAGAREALVALLERARAEHR